jgi:hypothetical protein
MLRDVAMLKYAPQQMYGPPLRRKRKWWELKRRETSELLPFRARAPKML